MKKHISLLKNYSGMDRLSFKNLLILMYAQLDKIYRQNEKKCCRSCAEIEDITAGLLDAQDVQNILRITKSTYYRWVQQGILNPRSVNKKAYYRKSDIERLIAQRKYRERGV